jgi:type II secretory pathway pseudopilin PulG
MIELAMVLLVIGIMGAMIMPRFGGMLDRQQMRRTINRMRGTVRYLQAQAAVNKCVYRLAFDLDQQVMSARPVEGCLGEDRDVLPAYALPTAVRILDVVSPEGEKTKEGEATTLFHPTGLAEPSTIHLGGDNVRQFTVMIEPLAGRVKVLDGYVDPTTS